MAEVGAARTSAAGAMAVAAHPMCGRGATGYRIASWWLEAEEAKAVATRAAVVVVAAV